MDVADDVRPREAEDIVAALEVDKRGDKLLSPPLALAYPVALHHRAHGAVQDHDALLENFTESGE